MNEEVGRVGEPTGLSQVEPANSLAPTGFDPSRWPSSAEVLAELKHRNPERYGQCKDLHYTPGDGDGASLEEVVAQFENFDREMANPYLRVASRLGGEAFLLSDEAKQRTDYSEGWPGVLVPLTPEKKHKGRLAELLREAERLLREAAKRDT